MDLDGNTSIPDFITPGMAALNLRTALIEI